MSKNKSTFLEKLDDAFVIGGEMIPDHGEDSYFCANNKDSIFLGVFDGCGGLGARTYREFDGKTGAYIASRIVSGAMHDWYHNFQHNELKSDDKICNTIKQYIMTGYNVCSSKVAPVSMIKGSMVRDFPTTAAMIYSRIENDNVVLYCFWAGDSRVYLIDGNGLAQITEDDIDNEDAFSNLMNDSPMNNVLSSDGVFTLHFKKVQINEPSSVFVATDGCFGYISSPMEFEYLILKCITEANNSKDFGTSLEQEIQSVAADDYSFGFMNIGYGSYSKFKKCMIERRSYIESEYINKINNSDDLEILSILWKKYKPNYERFFTRR